MPSPRKRLAIAGVLGATVIAVLLIRMAQSEVVAEEKKNAQPIYVLTVDPENRSGDIVVVDRDTGAVVKRIRTQDQPDFAVTSVGDRLFVLETARSKDLKTPTHMLSSIDTRSWRVLARATLLHRILYPVTGPSGLILSPTGDKLFVYSYEVLGDGRAEYWLTAVDADSLKQLQVKIPLPGCGGAHFVQAGGDIAALCSGSNDVRFIDPETDSVVASVELPAVERESMDGRPSGIVVGGDKGNLYVVTNDLRILEIDSTSRRLVREITRWRLDPGVVPPGTVSIQSTGPQLLVGELADRWASSPSFKLWVFDLPDMTLQSTLPLQEATVFVPVEGDGLYVFTPGKREVNRLNLGRSEVSRFLTVDSGGIYRITP